MNSLARRIASPGFLVNVLVVGAPANAVCPVPSISILLAITGVPPASFGPHSSVLSPQSPVALQAPEVVKYYDGGA